MNVRQESLYRWQELYFPLPDVVPLSESDGTVQLHHLPAYHRDKWYHPESFDSYIAIDPSLWWDRGVFLQQAAKNVYQKDFSGKHLYVAFATRQRPAIKLIQFSLADSLKNKIIPEMKNKHLHVVYKKFPDEVHGTIALPAIFDGLKSLFHNTISTKEAT